MIVMQQESLADLALLIAYRCDQCGKRGMARLSHMDCRLGASRPIPPDWSQPGDPARDRCDDCTSKVADAIAEELLAKAVA